MPGLSVGYAKVVCWGRQGCLQRVSRLSARGARVVCGEFECCLWGGKGCLWCLLGLSVGEARVVCEGARVVFGGCHGCLQGVPRLSVGCPNTTLLAPLPYPPYLYISFYFYIWNCNNVAIVQEVELEMAVAFLFPCLLLTQRPHARRPHAYLGDRGSNRAQAHMTYAEFRTRSTLRGGYLHPEPMLKSSCCDPPPSPNIPSSSTL